jgi:hypothetical protein
VASAAVAAEVASMIPRRDAARFPERAGSVEVLEVSVLIVNGPFKLG